MNRKEILAAAEKCVCGNREQDYGNPENNFLLIAQFWEAYLKASCIASGTDVCILPEDVAAMLAMLKIARIATGHAKEDNWIDLAGYAACGGEIQRGIQDGLKAGEGCPIAIDAIPGDFMEVHHKGHTAMLVLMPQGRVVGCTELGGITSVLYGEDLDAALNDFHNSVDCYLEQQANVPEE